MKNCSKCKQEKPLTEFAVYNGKPWCWCRQCQRASSRNYARNNKDKIREQDRKWREKNPGYSARHSREWRAKNPEKVKAINYRMYHKHKEKTLVTNRKKNLWRDYRMTVEQYEEMLLSQNGVCAICKTTDTSGRRLGVDHCHKTGKVRALLCINCNLTIGTAKESVDVLKAIIAYLEKHQTLAQLGI